MKPLRLAFLLVLACGTTVPAAADMFTAEGFKVFADFRLRAESDWDSQDSSGTAREDRTRMRVRVRTGFRYQPNENWQVEVRLRSGADASQQSPHVTILDFDDNDTGDIDFNFDRWYVQGRSGSFYGWAGRNSLPIWKQNEMLFDDDATMPGVGGGWKSEVGAGQLAFSAGYFAPPVGMRGTSGNLGLAQAVFAPKVGGATLTFAVGLFDWEANAGDPDAAALLQGNGLRDYQIFNGSVQARVAVGGRDLKFGVDLYRNQEDYSPMDPDPFTAANFDQTDGQVAQVVYGSTGDRGQWLVGYYYADIEALAVNNSYAQDDWVRWGSAAQTRGSDFKGHELRFGAGLTKKMNLIARLYVVEAITSVEDGKRLRLDLNYSF